MVFERRQWHMFFAHFVFVFSLCLSIVCFFKVHVVFVTMKLVLVRTLQYRIVVHASLFICRENVFLHGLISSYMIINSLNWPSKNANFGHFRSYYVDPTCLFEIEISSPYTLIPSCTTVRYWRVHVMYSC